MTKVKLCFTLVGKTNQYKSFLSDGKQMSWTNANTLQYVKDIVSEYFGSRAMFIINEKTLCEGSIYYPKYFSAGWFVSVDENPSELVLIAHSETMAIANKILTEYIKNIDWCSTAVKI